MADPTVKVTHDGTYWVLTIAGQGFGERQGTVVVRDENDHQLTHVNITSWKDREVVAQVPDMGKGGNVGGMMAGEKWTVDVVPVPGHSASFDVPKPEESDERQSSSESHSLPPPKEPDHPPPPGKPSLPPPKPQAAKDKEDK